MANETIGHVPCAHCGESSEVRRYKTGARKLYYHCMNCGQIRPSLNAGQRWIEANTTWIGQESEAVEADEPAPPADSPAPAEPEPPKRQSLFGGIDL